LRLLKRLILRNDRSVGKSKSSREDKRNRYYYPWANSKSKPELSTKKGSRVSYGRKCKPGFQPSALLPRRNGEHIMKLAKNHPLCKKYNDGWLEAVLLQLKFLKVFARLEKQQPGRAKAYQELTIKRHRRLKELRGTERKDEEPVGGRPANLSVRQTYVFGDQTMEFKSPEKLVPTYG